MEAMETWLPCPLDERYSVSTYGRIRGAKGGVLNPTDDGYGYYTVRIGRLKSIRLHKVVALTYLGERPAGHHIRHLDGNTYNNRPDNLQYGTQVENEADKVLQFAQVYRDNGNRIYEWEAYRYNGCWAYGSSAERLRLISLDTPGPVVPADFPVKILKFEETGMAVATCGTCHRSWDDAISTELTPAPAGRCPFEYFHASTDALVGS